MARLENVITSLVDMFIEHADGDGKLSKDEFKKLLEEEISNKEIKEKICASGRAARFMDKNRDGQIDFKEFCRCVGLLAKGHYSKKTGKTDDDDE